MQAAILARTTEPMGQLNLASWSGVRGFSLTLMVGEAEQRERFSFALQKAMQHRGMSARQLAIALEVDPRRVLGWLKGKGLPNLYEAQALAVILKVDESLFRNPPAVPLPPPEPYYPLEQYLLGAVDAGVAQGQSDARRAERAPGAPARSPRPRRAATGRG